MAGVCAKRVVPVKANRRKKTDFKCIV